MVTAIAAPEVLTKRPFVSLRSYFVIVGAALALFHVAKLITAIGPLPENGVVEAMPMVIKPGFVVVLANIKAPDMREPPVTLGVPKVVVS